MRLAEFTCLFNFGDTVLLLYDYFLTFPLEVSEIWRGRFTIIKGLFCINRYSAILCQIGIIFIDFFKPATDVVSLYQLSTLHSYRSNSGVSIKDKILLNDFIIIVRCDSLNYIVNISSVFNTVAITGQYAPSPQH